MVLAAFAAASLMTSQPAAAFDIWNRPDLRYHEFDPDKARELDQYYGYFYDPRGYYPYYNSGEWGPPYIKRSRGGPLPPYYAAWGSSKWRYNHVEWHRLHYGGHRRGNW
jgi:hypothetical protein